MGESPPVAELTNEIDTVEALINYFDNDLRVSALAGGNNINSPGLQLCGEIEKMFESARYVSMNSNGSFNHNGRAFGWRRWNN